MAIHRIPFLCLDARWQAKWKWLWDDFAGPNETYTGYIDAWDSLPWQRVMFDDGIERDHNNAAQAQYIPKYAGEILGTVEDLARILNDDGILYDEIIAQYSQSSPAGLVNLKRILYKDFDTTAPVCSAVYSRPMSYTFGGIGHIGDNAQQMFFVRAAECCDGTEGLRISLAPATWKPELRADAIHFARIVKPDEIPEVPERARLVVYAIAAGSCPRLKINDTWFPISPIYLPPYGDPYGFIWKGYKHIVGNIVDLGLTFEEENNIIVEHIAPRPESIGAQVFFVFEWNDEPEFNPIIRRGMMAENKRITRNPAEHLEHLRICWNKNENPDTPPEYKFPDREKNNLEDAYNTVRRRYDEWKTRSYKYSELTAVWAVMSKDALDFIGRVRSFWRARFGEGNTYEITAGIDDRPRRKTLLYMALHDICTVSNDNPGSDIELPASLRDACWSLYEDMRDNVDATQEALMDKNDSYEELKIAITEKGLPALRACREILYMILPQSKRDSLIIAWGFDPWDYPVHHKPADQKLTDTSYDPETDIAIIRGTEDPTADEYILEYAMTQSPAVEGWTPAEWEVFMTSDEPYFETEALREGYTYAFRMRARNGAGYGGYSEVWVVEVV